MLPELSCLARLSDDELIERHRGGDRAALEELTNRYRSLALGLARRYSYTRETADDLKQVAYIGLVAAINRYDPSRGKPLRAFAIPTILGELRRHFRDTGWAVHMPRPLQERAREVHEATDKLTVQLQRSPTPREVAEHVQLRVEDVIESRAVRRAYHADSLDAAAPSGDDENPGTWDSLHGVEDDGYARVEAGVSVERAMRALPEREQQIIRLRFSAELTQAEIGDMLGISQMHVSRLLRRSLDRVGAIVTSGYPTTTEA